VADETNETIDDITRKNSAVTSTITNPGLSFDSESETSPTPTRVFIDQVI